MQIVKLIVVDYSPLKIQSGIKRLTYEPQQIMQLILGDNGSGKSSLFNILSFSVPDKTAFDENGYRELHLKDDDHYYRLIDDYSGRSPHHEFWVDDLNLNDGYTQTVQKELCGKHLNYSSFIHNILSGKLRFCDMPKRAREDLLIKISGLDLDYAFSMLEVLKNNVKETNGIIRHVTSKYHDLTARLSALGGTEGLSERTQKLTENINTYFNQTNFSANEVNVDAKAEVFLQKINQAQLLTEQSYQKLHRYLKNNNVKLSDFNDIEHISNTVQRLSHEKDTLETEKKKLQEELGGYEDLIKRIDELPENVNAQQLRDQIADIDKKRQEIAEIAIVDERFDPTIVRNHTLAASQALLALKDHKEADDTGWTKETVTEALTAYREGIEKTNQLRDKVSRGKKKLEHMDLILEGVTVCPNCSTYIYKDPTVSKGNRQRVADKLQVVETELIEQEKKLEVLEAKKDEANRASRNAEHAHQIVRDNPTVKDAFRGLGGGYGVINNIDAVLAKLHQMEIEADALIKRNALDERRKELTFFLDTIDANDPQKVKGRYRQIEETLYACQSRQLELTKKQKAYGELVKLYRDFDKTLTEALQLFSQGFEQWEDIFTLYSQKAVNDYVSSLQTELATVKKSLQDHEMLQTQIDELEKEDETIRTRAKHLAALVDALNHRTGVIGDQLNIVNTGFVNAVNKIIDNIWEKDVVLQYPETGKKSGNFYVAINGRVGPELSMLSSGQKDIFNLAVSLVVMSQLNLKDYPLFLDEVGATFDERHRDNLMFFIKDLVMSGTVSMVFMISHYAENHGGFSNVDVSVLDDSNISIQTDKINEFFLIER